MTPSISNAVFVRRPLLDVIQGEIHILDLLSLPCDGAFPRSRLSDSLFGMLQLAVKFGWDIKKLVEAFETMFVEGPFLRRAAWDSFGEAFTGPDGLPMKFKLFTRKPEQKPFSILLHGNPEIQGESRYTDENLLQSPNALEWIISTILAGWPTAGFIYKNKLRSFNISIIPLDLTSGEVDYESPDEETDHGPGTSPWKPTNNLSQVQYTNHPIGKVKKETKKKTDAERK